MEPETPAKTAETTATLRLCAVEAVEEGEALRVEVDGRAPLAVYRVDGEFYVSDDTCSHGEASLAEGLVEGTSIECPWHSGRFCLKTGAALTFPAIEPIRVYPALVKEGAVFIHADDSPA